MQAFYCSNEKKEDKLFVDTKKVLNEKTDSPAVSGFYMRIFYSNNHLSYYEKGGDFVANNGVFVYKDQFNKRALQLFYEDLAAGHRLSELLLKAHGQFFLVAYLKGKLHIATDKFRTIPVFLLKSKNIIDISNMYYLLTRNTNVEYSINFDYLAQQVSGPGTTMHFYSGGTLFNEISYLDPGTIFTLEKNEIKKELYYDIKKDIEFGKYKSVSQVLDALVPALEANYKFLDNIDKIFCGITGGCDTRLSLSTLLKKGKAFSCGNCVLTKNWYLRKGKFCDSSILKQIREQFNLPYEDFGTNPDAIKKWVADNKKFVELQKDTAGASDRYYYYNSVARKFDIELTGFGGSEVLNKYSYRFFKKGGKFSAEEFLKTQHYNDILQDRYYDKKRYEQKIREYMSDLVKGITYSDRGDLLTYILYDISFKNFLNDYTGAINMLCPAYSPYLEPDFIKIMMETPYRLKGFHTIQRRLYDRVMDERLRNIATTHGYPPRGITPGNFYRFLRLLNPIDPCLQYYGPLGRLRIFYGTYLHRMNRPNLHNIEPGNPIYKYLDAAKINKKKLFVTTNLSATKVSMYTNRFKCYSTKEVA